MKIAGYLPNSTVDGVGVRQVFFTQGCPHHCEGCHNSQTWDITKGTEWSIDKIVSTALKSPFNVTFSGGDPLCQSIELREICMSLKPFKSIWVYTGYTWEEIMLSASMRTVLPFIDVLVDGKFVKELRNTKLLFRGSSNQRLIDVKESLLKNEIVLWERLKNESMEYFL